MTSSLGVVPLPPVVSEVEALAIAAVVPTEAAATLSSVVAEVQEAIPVATPSEVGVSVVASTVEPAVAASSCSFM